MPYIRQHFRKKFDKTLCKLENQIVDKGELEYIVFKLMLIYMQKKEYRYSNLHDVVYAVMHCADEFRRRYLDKREDMAIRQNGDIT